MLAQIIPAILPFQEKENYFCLMIYPTNRFILSGGVVARAPREKFRKEASAFQNRVNEIRNEPLSPTLPISS